MQRRVYFALWFVNGELKWVPIVEAFKVEMLRLFPVASLIPTELMYEICEN